MEKKPEKSIKNFKENEIDGQNVKGGFSLVKKENDIGHYSVSNMDYAKVNALSDARQQGFTYAKLTPRGSSESVTIKIS